MDERLRTTEIAGVHIHYNENHILQNTNAFPGDIANKENQKVFVEEKKYDGKESVILAPKQIVDYGKPFYDILSAEYLKRKGVQPSSPDQLIVFYQAKMKGGEYCFKDGEKADDPASIKQTIYTYHQQKEKEIAELRKQRIQEMNLKKEKELKTQQIKNNTLRKTVIGKLGLGDANGSFCDEDLGVGSFVTQFQKDGRKDGRLVTPENVLEFVAAKEPKVDPLPTIEELQTFFDKKLSSVK